ncbi:hypothetical protein QN277_024770 [Acacia crassicarpa]|uniref:Uncharacterized protein n=1 Tax=Acacia crassicarpa TaxID=499986 RepID=A0AAE1MPF1_9FABA|nr:hypothetical protein QN277_024756 [Acacia crassicarpa]KAK4268054.1 hypothetical protein QN277_024759 [Acacia crassicarpa]KAK4268057.1 hypothetical protein QN277_024762 [Acacia crassicarpa]KAK4268061.1 hypothetical protein QN277_024766 [Acacia crassicarpa]KAK4268065.1 hypothetical protein QN277_024770 [Acacia crassicarpa]
MKLHTEEDKEKGVPAFWLIAMKNNEVLAEEELDRKELHGNQSIPCRIFEALPIDQNHHQGRTIKEKSHIQKGPDFNSRKG